MAFALCKFTLILLLSPAVVLMVFGELTLIFGVLPRNLDYGKIIYRVPLTGLAVAGPAGNRLAADGCSELHDR